MAKRKMTTPVATGEKMSDETFRNIVQMARTRLINDWPFAGHLCLSLRPRMALPEDGVLTAAVSIDGTLTLNPDFLASLKPEEVCGLMAHEVMHPALFCFQRRGDRNVLVEINGGQVVTLWNLAHDLSFNTMIAEQKSTNIKLPEGAALDAKYKDHAAEEIYDLLLTEAEKKPSKAQGSQGQASGKVGQDSSIGDDMRNDLASTPEGQKAAKGDTGAKKKIEADWKVGVVAAAQAQEQRDKGRGNLPAWLQRMIHEIVNPKLDWREELSRWVGENGPRNDYSFRRPSRRSAGVGTYLPSMTKHGIVDDVTVLIDTSGSISQDRLKEALGEIQGICDDLQIGVRAIIVDADVHDDLTAQDALEIAAKLSGGGGSDFNPAFKRLEEEYYNGCVIAFTDGDIAVPESMPLHMKGTLWVLRDGDRDPTGGRWGEVVRVPAEAVASK